MSVCGVAIVVVELDQSLSAGREPSGLHDQTVRLLETMWTTLKQTFNYWRLVIWFTWRCTLYTPNPERRREKKEAQ